ncbi:cyclin-dependent kinase-like 4 [Amphiura filiformis]|uniref:cyclin-dependent kinase-like 4 n=1 Tax=Amphiura filiformis TaxID=82378 RepID=UPI003B22541E
MKALTAMEKYENMGLVGEGSYGMVLKCRHRETSQTVAIKKFIESEDDKMVKKIAMREVRMLKQLRHENLVNLIEVFRRKKRLYLVFEFVDHTILDELEKYPTGLSDDMVRKYMWQVLRGIEFCHLHSIIHRDIKPENILVSKGGVLKLCDFGFARTIAGPGEVYTDYVATRWYRAPELLVGDPNYGKAVDIWAVGCLQAEMLTGEPLFPGDSDIDQLYHIIKCFGTLIPKHKETFMKNPLFVGMRLPEAGKVEPLEKRFPQLSTLSLTVMKLALHLDPDQRPTCHQLLRNEYFKKDGFSDKFPSDLRSKIHKEFEDNPLLKIGSDDKDVGNEDGKKSRTKKSKKDHDGKERHRKKHSDTDGKHKSSSHSEKHQKDALMTEKKTQGTPDKGQDRSGIPSLAAAPSNKSSHQPKPMYGQDQSNQASINTLTMGNIVSNKTNFMPSNMTGPPPLRANEKMTKKTVNNSFYKSSSQPTTQGYHSHSVSPDKNFQFDSHKTKNKHRGSKDESDIGTHLPDLTGKTSDHHRKHKTKKSHHTTMPQIATLDVSSGSSSLHAATSNHRGQNLPAV